MSKQANDQKVQQLMAVVEERKEEIKKLSKRQAWRTNQAFRFDDRDLGNKPMINLNTVNDERSICLMMSFLLEKENHWTEAREMLGLDKEPFQWNGFTITDWKDDLKDRLDRIQIDDKKKQLATLEKKLSKLLSEEARNAKELDEIEKLLGDD